VRIWRQAALILPVSDFIRGELAAKGCPADKMVVQYNGVDPQKFAPAEKQKLILFAGRWVEKKGVDTLIDALALLKDELAGWRVRLIGDGDLKPALVEKLSAAGVAVELPGWVSPDAMPEEYAAAMIVCVPSRRASTGDAEGLPMVCIEAMLSGCAILGARHAGIPECVTDGVCGLLADEGDSAGLAARLRSMISDVPRTLAMGEAGRVRARKDFNLALQSARLEQLLLGVAKPVRTGA
jgi:glycosyltransferase involved in cell wall biosynthesis